MHINLLFFHAKKSYDIRMNQYSWIPFLIIALDQISKRIAMYWEYNNITIQFYFLENKIIWNKGISFGLFATSYYNMIIYSAIFISIILVIMAFIKSKNKIDAIAWGLIVGGGLSNLWDRWFFEAVLDFISISFGEFNFPIFNIADVAITFGALILSRKIFSNSKKKNKVNSEPKK